MTTSVTDVGFLAPPGLRRLRLEAPDCAAEERDVEISPSHATTLDGSMRIVTPPLRGTTGAPDGLDFLLGAFRSTVPRSIAAGDGFSFDRSSIAGAMYSVGGETRHTVFALDQTFGYGSLSGQFSPKDGAAPNAMSGSLLALGMTFRLGARVALHDVALMAGSGLGGALWIRHAEAEGPGRYDPPTSLNRPGVSWHVPLWAGVTVKPSCDWGLQLMASYSITPTDSEANTTSLVAGILFQPSRACSEVPGVSVTP